MSKQTAAPPESFPLWQQRGKQWSARSVTCVSLLKQQLDCTPSVSDSLVLQADQDSLFSRFFFFSPFFLSAGTADVTRQPGPEWQLSSPGPWQGPAEPHDGWALSISRLHLWPAPDYSWRLLHRQPSISPAQLRSSDPSLGDGCWNEAITPPMGKACLVVEEWRKNEVRTEGIVSFLPLFSSQPGSPVYPAPGHNAIKRRQVSFGGSATTVLTLSAPLSHNIWSFSTGESPFKTGWRSTSDWLTATPPLSSSESPQTWRWDVWTAYFLMSSLRETGVHLREQGSANHWWKKIRTPYVFDSRWPPTHPEAQVKRKKKKLYYVKRWFFVFTLIRSQIA